MRVVDARPTAGIYTEIAVGNDPSKIPLSQAGRISDLMKLVPNAKVSTSAKELFQKLHNIDEVPSIAKPRTLKATLRPYQKLGFSWLVFLHELGSGGILADDMGLGKTLQTIAHVLLEKEAGRLTQPVLIVTLTSLVGNWQREFAKFAPGLSVIPLHGAGRQHVDLAVVAEGQRAVVGGAEEAHRVLGEARHLLGRLGPRQVHLPDVEAAALLAQVVETLLVGRPHRVAVAGLAVAEHDRRAAGDRGPLQAGAVGAAAHAVDHALTVGGEHRLGLVRLAAQRRVGARGRAAGRGEAALVAAVGAHEEDAIDLLAVAEEGDRLRVGGPLRAPVVEVERGEAQLAGAVRVHAVDLGVAVAVGGERDPTPIR